MNLEYRLWHTRKQAGMWGESAKVCVDCGDVATVYYFTSIAASWANRYLDLVAEDSKGVECP